MTITNENMGDELHQTAKHLYAVTDQENSHPHDEGVFIATSSSEKFYQPAQGILIAEKTKEVNGGKVHIGSYLTDRASHRTGIYIPDGYDHNANWPTVLMTTPLGTAAEGHNARVARSMMRRNFVVVAKGPPRYHGPTLKALTLTEDTNEMFGLQKEVESSGLIAPSKEIIMYGESQGAMKALGGLVIGQFYGKETIDALAVDPCYFKKIDLRRPDKQAIRLLGMLQGTASFIKSTTSEDRRELAKTFNLKDLPHHILVIPVLVSGETGKFLDHIPEDQHFTVPLFAKRGISEARKARAELKERFSNVDARLYNQYGHVDGIMSPETASLRDAMLFEKAKKYDMPPAA